MSLLYPELLLLAVPVAFALWKSTPEFGLRLVLRVLTATALLLALAGPHGGGSVSGRDLVVVIDRSRSMPAGGQASVAEIIKLAGEEMQSGDRMAVLTFAADHAIEQAPSASARLEGYATTLDVDGTNMTAALDQALALIPENRPGSILLYSDGEFHGTAPDSVARRAAARGIQIDVRSARQSTAVDVAVDEIELPSSVEVGEPFQFAAWVRSDRAVEAKYTLLRGETVINRGTRKLRSGLNQLLFRDLGQAAGLARYRLRLEVDEDRVLANNVGLGVMRVEGNRPLLVINSDGGSGRLATALQGAGMKVQVVAAANLPTHDPAWLENFRGIVLENVPASDLGAMLPAIANQVRDLGTGLVMTGGRASFGLGGYYQSRLDPLLPVSMEMRVEHRKAGLALAFVLDRSGSMGAAVGDGLTKMDLANAGTMSAIQLLSRLDEVTVIAVDSEPHMIVPLTQVDDPAEFTQRVSGIQSGGGGIYTYNGLKAAADELAGTSRTNRHIVLFADAADAEQPHEYVKLLADLTTNKNTTVSVVALGDGGDSDAAFLRDVASRGGGEIYFSQDPVELPRLFAQDTLLAARSSFIDIATATESTPGLHAITNLATGPWRNLPGYNLCYLRPGASQGARTTDEYGAPVIATMQAGLGRTAAFTGQVSGDYQVAAADWPEVANMLVTMTRWVSAQSSAQQYFTSVEREGREAVVSIDVDRSAGDAPVGALTARMVAPDGTRTEIDLIPVSADRFEARVPIGMEGVYRFAAATDQGEMLMMDPLAIPYSPEFEPRLQRDSGEAVLGRIARLSGGKLNPPISELMRGNRKGKAMKPWAPWFGLAALLLFLSEIAWRRLFEGSVKRPSWLHRRKSAPAAASAPGDAATDRLAGVLGRRNQGKPEQQPAKKPERPKEPEEAKPSADLGDVLSGAKRRASRRTKN